MNPAPEISIVIPTYNEEDSVEPLAKALREVLDGLRRPYEVLFIDDGSTDGTGYRLGEILRESEHFRAVHLVQNAGQTAALCAGIDHARGEYIIAMDADLQNDPTDIPRIVARLDEGFDVVSGWRRSRQDHVSRRIPSIVANAILSKISGIKIHDFGCTLKGYRSAYINRVPLYSDMHRYLPAFATAIGARVTEIEVKHHPRRFGSSKYGMGRIYRVMIDLLVLQMLLHFAFRPLHWFGRVAIIVFLLSGAILIPTWLSGRGDPIPETTVAEQTLESTEPNAAAADAGNWRLMDRMHSTIVFPAIIVLGIYLGTTLLSLGFLCELVNRVSDPSMQPLFAVRDLERVTG